MPLQSGSFNVLFIGQNALIENGLIDANIDTSVLQPIIKLAQDKWIQDIIGTPMMVYLQNAIANNTLTSNDTLLLNPYIERCLCWYVTYELCFFNTFKMKIKGLQKMGGDNSQAASLSEVESYQNKARSTAEFYGQRTLRHLEANPTLFPAFSNAPYNIDDIIPNRRSAYQCSIYLGSDRGYESSFSGRW